MIKYNTQIQSLTKYDLNNEDIKGSFYGPELLKKKQALVKWKEYDDKFIRILLMYHNNI